MGVRDSGTAREILDELEKMTRQNRPFSLAFHLPMRKIACPTTFQENMMTSTLHFYQEIKHALKERARELCPDYPNVDRELGEHEYLWAITTSLEGTRAANDDLHELIAELQRCHNIPQTEVLQIGQELMEKRG
jgi:hypothetical protein